MRNSKSAIAFDNDKFACNDRGWREHWKEKTSDQRKVSGLNRTARDVEAWPQTGMSCCMVRGEEHNLNFDVAAAI